MILHDEQLVAERALERLVEIGVAPETAFQIAKAVAANEAAAAWDSAELDFRLARALDQLGYGDASRALLQQAVPVQAAASPENLLRVPPAVLPLLRAGILRECGDNVWKLDGSAVAKLGVPHELSYARLLEIFAANLPPLWDATQGRGTLSLSGWLDHAAIFHPRRRSAVRHCRDWRRDISESLERKGRLRGWTTSPEVVIADPM